MPYPKVVAGSTRPKIVVGLTLVITPGSQVPSILDSSTASPTRGRRGLLRRVVGRVIGLAARRIEAAGETAA